MAGHCEVVIGEGLDIDALAVRRDNDLDGICFYVSGENVVCRYWGGGLLFEPACSLGSSTI